MRPVCKYINLTNGIEAITREDLEDYRFIRIQSTACEQKRWDFIIQDLDYSFLMDLAIGHYVIVFDYGKRGYVRAMWQGLEWIKYATSRFWLGKVIIPKCKGLNVSGYFNRCYEQMEDSTKIKLRYFMKFLNTDMIRLAHMQGKTSHDGDYEHYRKLLINAVTNL